MVLPKWSFLGQMIILSFGVICAPIGAARWVRDMASVTEISSAVLMCLRDGGSFQWRNWYGAGTVAHLFVLDRRKRAAKRRKSRMERCRRVQQLTTLFVFTIMPRTAAQRSINVS
jgi:hypothetical protein